MRIKEGFTLRKILKEYMVVAEGIKNIDFSKIISLNESSAHIWKNMEGKEFTVEDMARCLTEEYDVEYDTAWADSKVLAEKWIEIGVAE